MLCIEVTAERVSFTRSLAYTVRGSVKISCVFSVYFSTSATTDPDSECRLQREGRTGADRQDLPVLQGFTPALQTGATLFFS